MPLLTFWYGEGRWRGYKATSLSLLIALLQTFVENYWVFTNTPLDQNNTHAQGAQKTFYMTGEIAATLAIYGMIGLSLDYVRKYLPRSLPPRPTSK